MRQRSELHVRPSDAGAPDIRMHRVTKTFGDVGVVDLSIEVTSGTILGLVGPSGCGKTTTVRLLTGIYRPDTGEIRVLGDTPGRMRPQTRTRIGYMPQHYVLSQHMTVWNTLWFAASLYGLPWRNRRAHLRDILGLVDLINHQSKRVAALSGGMQRRLSLACTLVHRPDLIFADEPTAGIDPDLRARFWEHFRDLRDRGHTLFVTTQYIGEVEHCDRVAVMREGRLVALETPTGLRRRAMGGDAIILRVNPADAARAAEIIRAASQVKSVRLSQNQPGTLYTTFTEASSALPHILRLLGEPRSGDPVQVLHIAEYKPSFDEIFMLLMEQIEGELRAADMPIGQPALRKGKNGEL
jgi:ABC-2 type transport system ATP-binding protein